jgi:hypothetical protein
LLNNLDDARYFGCGRSGVAYVTRCVVFHHMPRGAYVYVLCFCIATGWTARGHNVQTDSGDHTATYSMGMGGAFPGLKAAGA